MNSHMRHHHFPIYRLKMRPLGLSSSSFFPLVFRFTFIVRVLLLLTTLLVVLFSNLSAPRTRTVRGCNLNVGDVVRSPSSDCYLHDLPMLVGAAAVALPTDESSADPLLLYSSSLNNKNGYNFHPLDIPSTNHNNNNDTDHVHLYDAVNNDTTSNSNISSSNSSTTDVTTTPAADGGSLAARNHSSSISLTPPTWTDDSLNWTHSTAETTSTNSLNWTHSTAETTSTDSLNRTHSTAETTSTDSLNWTHSTAETTSTSLRPHSSSTKSVPTLTTHSQERPSTYSATTTYSASTTPHTTAPTASKRRTLTSTNNRTTHSLTAVSEFVSRSNSFSRGLRSPSNTRSHTPSVVKTASQTIIDYFVGSFFLGGSSLLNAGESGRGQYSETTWPKRTANSLNKNSDSSSESPEPLLFLLTPGGGALSWVPQLDVESHLTATPLKTIESPALRDALNAAIEKDENKRSRFSADLNNKNDPFSFNSRKASLITYSETAAVLVNRLDGSFAPFSIPTYSPQTTSAPNSTTISPNVTTARPLSTTTSTSTNTTPSATTTNTHTTITTVVSSSATTTLTTSSSTTATANTTTSTTLETPPTVTSGSNVTVATTSTTSTAPADGNTSATTTTSTFTDSSDNTPDESSGNSNDTSTVTVTSTVATTITTTTVAPATTSTTDNSSSNSSSTANTNEFTNTTATAITEEHNSTSSENEATATSDTGTTNLTLSSSSSGVFTTVTVETNTTAADTPSTTTALTPATLAAPAEETDAVSSLGRGRSGSARRKIFFPLLAESSVANVDDSNSLYAASPPLLGTPIPNAEALVNYTSGEMLVVFLARDDCYDPKHAELIYLQDLASMINFGAGVPPQVKENIVQNYGGVGSQIFPGGSVLILPDAETYRKIVGFVLIVLTAVALTFAWIVSGTGGMPLILLSVLQLKVSFLMRLCVRLPMTEYSDWSWWVVSPILYAQNMFAPPDSDNFFGVVLIHFLIAFVVIVLFMALTRLRQHSRLSFPSIPLTIGMFLEVGLATSAWYTLINGESKVIRAFSFILVLVYGGIMLVSVSKIAFRLPIGLSLLPYKGHHIRFQVVGAYVPEQLIQKYSVVVDPWLPPASSHSTVGTRAAILHAVFVHVSSFLFGFLASGEARNCLVVFAFCASVTVLYALLLLAFRPCRWRVFWGALVAELFFFGLLQFGALAGVDCGGVFPLNRVFGEVVTVLSLVVGLVAAVILAVCSSLERFKFSKVLKKEKADADARRQEASGSKGVGSGGSFDPLFEMVKKNHMEFYKNYDNLNELGMFDYVNTASPDGERKKGSDDDDDVLYEEELGRYSPTSKRRSPAAGLPPIPLASSRSLREANNGDNEPRSSATTSLNTVPLQRQTRGSTAVLVAPSLDTTYFDVTFNDDDVDDDDLLSVERHRRTGRKQRRRGDADDLDLDLVLLPETTDQTDIAALTPTTTARRNEVFERFFTELLGGGVPEPEELKDDIGRINLESEGVGVADENHEVKTAETNNEPTRAAVPPLMAREEEKRDEVTDRNLREPNRWGESPRHIEVRRDKDLLPNIEERQANEKPSYYDRQPPLSNTNNYKDGGKATFTNNNGNTIRREQQNIFMTANPRLIGKYFNTPEEAKSYYVKLSKQFRVDFVPAEVTTVYDLSSRPSFSPAVTAAVSNNAPQKQYAGFSTVTRITSSALLPRVVPRGRGPLAVPSINEQRAILAAKAYLASVDEGAAREFVPNGSANVGNGSGALLMMNNTRQGNYSVDSVNKALTFSPSRNDSAVSFNRPPLSPRLLGDDGGEGQVPVRTQLSSSLPAFSFGYENTKYMQATPTMHQTRQDQDQIDPPLSQPTTTAPKESSVLQELRLAAGGGGASSKKRFTPVRRAQLFDAEDNIVIQSSNNNNNKREKEVDVHSDLRPAKTNATHPSSHTAAEENFGNSPHRYQPRQLQKGVPPPQEERLKVDSSQSNVLAMTPLAMQLLAEREERERDRENRRRMKEEERRLRKIEKENDERAERLLLDSVETSFSVQKKNRNIDDSGIPEPPLRVSQTTEMNVMDHQRISEAVHPITTTTSSTIAMAVSHAQSSPFSIAISRAPTSTAASSSSASVRRNKELIAKLAAGMASTNPPPNDTPHVIRHKETSKKAREGEQRGVRRAHLEDLDEKSTAEKESRDCRELIPVTETENKEAAHGARSLSRGASAESALSRSSQRSWWNPTYAETEPSVSNAHYRSSPRR